MELTLTIQNINFLSVVVASLSAFAIGSLWYSPLLFSKPWQKEIGLTDEDIKSANMPLIFGASFVLEFIGALVLDLFIGPQGTIKTGILISLLVGFGFVATSIGTNYLFGRKSLKLFLIDAGYFLLFFLIMGIILGAW